MIKIFSTFLLIACTSILSGQDARLAEQYFQDGEYEKAGILFAKLLDQNKNQNYYFNRLTDCLIYQDKTAEAETLVKKQLKSFPDEAGNYVVYGNLLDKMGQPDAAAEQYKKAIDKLPNDRSKITSLAGNFINMSKFDFAIAAYEKGMKVFNDKNMFPYLLADMYRRKDDVPKMIEYYLISLDADPQRDVTIESIFQRTFQPSDYLELQKQLYAAIQGAPRAIHFAEMLQWAMLQSRDYLGALRQARALDKMLDENGSRIYQIGQIAKSANEWDAAVKAFEYITKEKGPQNSFYVEAKKDALACKRNKIKLSASPTTMDELKVLEQDYESFIQEFGKNRASSVLIIEYAELVALHLNNIPKAIAILDELIHLPNIPRPAAAQAKLNLGDYYLVQGEIWEATLLYSQVDKAFKEDQLGEEARFRNARLTYFNGDFEWAQKQFDILKSATSRFISNDAIDLSVFILDNMAGDSVSVPLQYYAQAELLGFQNKHQAALEKLDSIVFLFPNHDIVDDVLYLRAKIYSQLKQWDQAIPIYQTIIEKYKEGIRCDNALFELAEIYDFKLNEKEKAKSLYETLFMDFSNSTFAVEARKRFRVLRGDKIQ
ncbi:MAG: tetratricopeptide repeat protein [Saprospiraceae bacterium]|jgi:tetratricopeptide (TPR) repeat protein|nr:tetratricopeptide repeat protein [Saprospiraceae bacterium]MBK7373285.1 tetratricopeptide repeat protein [Saprospiraceae bacterium]MBK8513011.1 tetratricopeptide repeat protein [Saprospiraceae bacterium]MBP7921708.1 tetratricopeptide repeat protein [Saprospiraceae bacterium]MBP9743951.1 tetratricopeptide repeat protein [Saprospiraceae bacterium]